MAKARFNEGSRSEAYRRRPHPKSSPSPRSGSDLRKKGLGSSSHCRHTLATRSTGEVTAGKSAGASKSMLPEYFTERPGVNQSLSKSRNGQRCPHCRHGHSPDSKCSASQGASPSWPHSLQATITVPLRSHHSRFSGFRGVLVDCISMWMPVNENWGDTISASVAGQTDFFAPPRE